MRLTSEAETTALRYGDTVSKGIVEMEYRITHPATSPSPDTLLQNATGTSFAVPELEDGMDARYWKRFKKEMDNLVERAQRGY